MLWWSHAESCMVILHCGLYILMSNLYAEGLGRIRNIRKGMREKNAQEVVWFSWVDIYNVKGSSHCFSSADTSHPLTDKIYRTVYFRGLETRSEFQGEGGGSVRQASSRLTWM